jgi:hypothetical protein
VTVTTTVRVDRLDTLHCSSSRWSNVPLMFGVGNRSLLKPPSEPSWRDQDCRSRSHLVRRRGKTSSRHLCGRQGKPNSRVLQLRIQYRRVTFVCRPFGQPATRTHSCKCAGPQSGQEFS